MRQPPTYTSWKITCHSSEEAQALQQWLSSRIDLDRVLTDTMRVLPNGVEQVRTVPHRLGNYFAAIRLLPDAQANPASFRLVFHRRPEAGRFWKDLMVNILQEMEAIPQKVSIALDSKGEMEPITPTAGLGHSPKGPNPGALSPVTSERRHLDDRRMPPGKEGTMNLLERNAMVTITPGFDSVPETLTQFRWRMHLSLPYPFPSKECVHQVVTILDKTFAFSVHNHYSRVIQTIRSGESGPVYFRVFLEDKRKPPGNYPDCVGFTREDLQSVVIFEEQTDYTSPKEAFAGADGKIKGCFDWLAAFLSACQRAAPYLTSWLVYPISMFDVGIVYHEVAAFCATHQKWNLFSSAVAVSLGRHLQRPTFVMEVPTSVDSNSPMDAANELLAEALMSLFRGMPRLTVLNAYTAVESLANVVFSRTKVAKLVANKMPQEMAEEIVEDERKRHRTEGNFLYHRGMKSASGRSLLEENKQQYDALLQLQEMRHKVAHTGYKPTPDEARDAHKACCEAAQWLAGVAGFPAKPLLPDASSSYPGFSTAFKDAQARNASEIELVRHLLGIRQAENDRKRE